MPSPTAGWQHDADAVGTMSGRLEEVAGQVNAHAAAIGDALITQGSLLEPSGGMAKHAWMMRVSH